MKNSPPGAEDLSLLGLVFSLSGLYLDFLLLSDRTDSGEEDRPEAHKSSRPFPGVACSLMPPPTIPRPAVHSALSPWELLGLLEKGAGRAFLRARGGFPPPPQPPTPQPRPPDGGYYSVVNVQGNWVWGVNNRGRRKTYDIYAGINAL